MAGPIDDLQLPYRVDAFTLDRCIGAGAMGAVYHASEDISGRQVAVKIMAGKLVGNQRAETRFRREISAMGQLRHPGIPAFAGYGDLPDGRPYLAMELINGHTLDVFVARDRPLPEDLALWVAQQLAGVIGYCHRETGMIHRDLKPGNVMVDLAGHVGLSEQSQLKILDFGLATYIDVGDFDDFRDIIRGYAGGGTMAGEVMGTPAYMSPEQIRGERLGFQSDIYAIGAILHHLLTGHLPYEGSSIGVVMSKHLSSPVPDPSQLVPLRPATVSVVQRAMAKLPAARYRSYNQLCAALQSARYAAVQATRRFVAPGEAHDQPAAPAVAAGQQPSSAFWPRPAVAAPEAIGTPPAQQPAIQPTSTRWRRPVATPPPAADPLPTPALDRPVTTSTWRRPVATPPPAADPLPTPALERPVTASTWRRPMSIPPPARPEEVHEPSDVVQPPPAPAATATPPVAVPPGTSQWRRPVRTPPPDQASPP